MAPCIICGKDSEHSLDRGAGPIVTCAICGVYQCDHFAELQIKSKSEDPDAAAKLAAFIKERNLQGIPPCFHSEPGGDYPREVTVDEALDAYPSSLGERTDRTLKNVYRLQRDYEGVAEFRHGLDHPYCFAKDVRGAVRFIHDLKDQNLLEDAGSHQQAMRVRLTMGAWSKIEKQIQETQESEENSGPIGFRTPQ